MNKDAKIIILGYSIKSRQCGVVYSTDGIAPTFCSGVHAGQEPRILEVYEDKKNR